MGIPSIKDEGRYYCEFKAKNGGKIQITVEFVIEYTVRGQTMGFRPGIRPTHTNLIVFTQDATTNFLLYSELSTQRS